MIYTFNKGEVFGIRFTGIGAEFKSVVETMVIDFNEPKFGYNGELWDEEYE